METQMILNGNQYLFENLKNNYLKNLKLGSIFITLFIYVKLC